MTETYFEWLREATPNRAWINNPTAEEVRLALAQGAVSCTTNPAYGGNLLGRAPDQIEPDIRAVVDEGASGDEAVALIQARLIGRILPHFAAIHEASSGREGWVSLQGAPELDIDPGPILASARSARALAPNCIPKIPATGPGLEVMETLVAEGEPVLMTEVFSLAQVAETCERYQAATRAAGTQPVFIMAPITGIFGDHLRSVAARDGVEISADDITWAGVIWSRAAKRLVDERAYPVQLLYGGARSIADLVALVGGGHASTINWSTFVEVLEADPEQRETADDETPAGVELRLTEAFDDFRRALDIDALATDEFEAFGPVQHFRNVFIAGWQAVREAVEAARGQA